MANVSSRAAPSDRRNIGSLPCETALRIRSRDMADESWRPSSAAWCCWLAASADRIRHRHSAFGRMGGFGRPMMGGPMWRRPPPPRGGRFVGPRPPGAARLAAAASSDVGGGAVGGGIVGGGIVGGAAARAAGGGNNGGGGAAAQGNAPFVPDEIVTSFAPGTTPQAIAQFAQRTNLAQLESQSFPLIGTSLYRWRIGGGRSVPSVVQSARRRKHRRHRAAELSVRAAGRQPRPRLPLPPARAMPLNMFWPSCKSRRRIRSRPENPSRSP